MQLGNSIVSFVTLLIAILQCHIKPIDGYDIYNENKHTTTENPAEAQEACANNLVSDLTAKFPQYLSKILQHIMSPESRSSMEKEMQKNSSHCDVKNKELVQYFGDLHRKTEKIANLKKKMCSLSQVACQKLAELLPDKTIPEHEKKAPLDFDQFMDKIEKNCMNAASSHSSGGGSSHNSGSGSSHSSGGSYFGALNQIKGSKECEIELAEQIARAMPPEYQAVMKNIYIQQPFLLQEIRAHYVTSQANSFTQQLKQMHASSAQKNSGSGSSSNKSKRKYYDY